ncbi:MAG TPA: hypothetical protein VGD75_18685 [Bradyrhizobium sp.]
MFSFLSSDSSSLFCSASKIESRSCTDCSACELGKKSRARGWAWPIGAGHGFAATVSGSALAERLHDAMIKVTISAAGIRDRMLLSSGGVNGNGRAPDLHGKIEYQGNQDHRERIAPRQRAGGNNHNAVQRGGRNRKNL